MAGGPTFPASPPRSKPTASGAGPRSRSTATTHSALRMRSSMEISDERLQFILDSIMIVERGYDVDAMSMVVSQLPELNYELTLSYCGQNDSVILGEESLVVLWRSAPSVWHHRRATWRTVICRVDDKHIRFKSNEDIWEAPRRSSNIETDLANQKFVHTTGCYICWEPVDRVTYKADVLIWL